VIDALIVTLGLDARGYEAGAAQATKTRQNLSGVATRAAKVDTDLARKHRAEQDAQAKLDEANAKRTVEGIQRIRNELLGLFALVTAGRGVKQLVGDIVLSDAAVGRLATGLGMATSELAAWQGVAERTGGTAQGITGSLQSISQEFERFKLTGEGGEFIPWLQNLGVGLVDAQGKTKSLTQLYLDLADAMKKQTPQDAIFKGAQMHMDAATSLMMQQQGGAGLRQLMAEQYKLGVPNDPDAKIAQKLLNDVADLKQAYVDFGRTILRQVAPAIPGMLQEMVQWIETNGPRLKIEILDKVKEFVGYIGSVDWAGIGGSIGHITDSIQSIVTALGGWKTASEALFAVWAVSKVSGLLSALSLFKLGVPGALIAGVGAAAVLNGKTEEAAQSFVPAASDRTSTDSWFAQKFGTGGAGWEGQSKASDDAMTKLPDVLERLLEFLNLGGSTTPASTDYSTATPSERIHAGMLLGAGSPGPDSAMQAARAKQAYDYYVKQGLTGAQASGLVARMKLESNFNPDNVGDHGAAYGIFQWHADRRAKISAYLGKSIIGSSFEDQLKGSVYEFRQGQEQAAGRALAAATSASQAGDVVSRQLIRPGMTQAKKDWEAHKTSELADRYYKQFTAPVAAPTPAMGALPIAPFIPLSALVPTPGDRYGGGNQYASTDNSSSTETHVGTINVHTQATDAKGVAAGIKGALARNDAGNAMMAAQMNRGVA